MTLTPETLMAFVDGELAPGEEARVAAEVAKDPALSAYVEQQKELAAKLRTAFAPVLEAPIPARIERIVRETKIPCAAPSPASFARASATDLARADGACRPGAGSLPARWRRASFSALCSPDHSGAATEMRTKGGALIAQGELARVLTTELASEQTGRHAERCAASA